MTPPAVTPPAVSPPVAPQSAAPQPVAAPSQLPQRPAADAPPTTPVATVRLTKAPTLTALPDLARPRKTAREDHPLFSKES